MIPRLDVSPLTKTFAVCSLLLSLSAPAFALPTNVLVNNPALDTSGTADTQNNPALVLGANGEIIAAYCDVAPARYTPTIVSRLGLSRSINGGDSFTDLGYVTPVTSGTYNRPTLARNSQNGRIYLSAEDLSVNVILQKSTDNGLTFDPSAVLGGVGDDPTIAVDNFPGTGQGNLYIAYKATALPGDPIAVGKSTDHGDTVSSPVTVSLPGATNPSYASLTISPDHSVYVAYLEPTLPGAIRVHRSTDGAATFGPGIIAAPYNYSTPPGELGIAPGAIVRPTLVSNPLTGHLYLTYPSAVTGDRGDIFFTYSTTAGATWSTPVRVNTDSTQRSQFQPSMAVTPDGTRLMIGYYDRRRDQTNEKQDYFVRLAQLTADGVFFQEETRITDQSFVATIQGDGVFTQSSLGVYSKPVADNNFFYCTWADTRLNGALRSNQPDIRMARIPVGGFPSNDAYVVGATLTHPTAAPELRPLDCFTLQATIGNIGNVPLTDAVAVLTINSPWVVVHNPVINVPPLAPGSPAEVTLPFNISTTADFPCLLDIDATITLEMSTGLQNFPIVLKGAETGPSASFANMVTTAIPDNDSTGTKSSVTVSGVTAPVGRFEVSASITHTYTGDLLLELIAPDGTTTTLAGYRGGAGNNYGAGCGDPTVFADAAATPISGGTAPFPGRYRPEQPLRYLGGRPPAAVNGTWVLKVSDNAQFDTGMLNCWSLKVFTGGCATGTGQCGPLMAVTSIDDHHITDGDVTPATNDGTDFGNASSVYPETREYIIYNNGGQPLVLGANAVSISGPGADAFSVITQPPSQIESGQAAVFAVRFAPVNGSEKTATISVNSNAPGNPYTFSVRGNHCIFLVSPPEFNQSAAPATGTINVTTTCNWTPEPSDDWIVIDSYDLDSVNFHVTQNLGFGPRSGWIDLDGFIVPIEQEVGWQKSGIDSGPEWFFDPASQDDVDLDASTAGQLGIVVRPSVGRLRILGWQNPQVMKYDDVGPDKYVSGRFHIYTSNDPSAPVNEVPNFRIRLQNEGAVVANTNYSHAQTGNGGTPHEPLYDLFNDVAGETVAGGAVRPSANSALPSIYRVDFDPVDVPAAAGTGIWAAFESFATANPSSATLALSEVSFATYAVPETVAGTPLLVYDYLEGAADTGATGGAKAFSKGGFNYANDFQAGRRQEIFFIGDGKGTLPSALATISEDAGQGILVDTLNSPADMFGVGIFNILSASNAQRARIEANKLYVARFHVTSPVPTTSFDSSATIQGSLNLSLMTAGGAVTSVFAVTGSQNASSPFDPTKSVAVQALPGLGSQNPESSPTLTFPGEAGGWYTVILPSPLNSDGIRADTENFGNLAAQPGPGSTANSARDIVIGGVILESAATLKLSPTYTAPNAQPNRGRVRITRIELHAYPDASNPS